MTPDQDRRRPRTSDTAGWHSFDYIVRQALEVQRDVGTPGAVTCTAPAVRRPCTSLRPA